MQKQASKKSAKICTVKTEDVAEIGILISLLFLL